MRTPILLLPFLAGLCFAPCSAFSAQAKAIAAPDYSDLSKYIPALQRSHDPKARAILRQVADGPAALKREKALAAKEGIPLTIKQLQKPLPAHNAAPLYDKWDTRCSSSVGKLPLPYYAIYPLSFDYAYTPEQIAAVQKMFDEYPDITALLHHAAGVPEFVMPINPKLDIISGSFRYFPELRRAARALRTESFLRAKAGRYSEAIRDQALSFHVAEHAASAPGILGNLVAIAVEGITLSSVKDILYLAGPNAEIDKQVEQMMKTSLPRVSLKAALKTDVPISLAGMDATLTGSPSEFASAIEWGEYTHSSSKAKEKKFSPAERSFATGIIDAAEARFLHEMRGLIAVADDPTAARTIAFKSAARTHGRDAPSSDPIDAVTQLILSVVGSLDNMDNSRRADEEVVMAGAAILADWARSGQYPEILPGEFIDPFTGGQLGYRREGGSSFVVYSVGPDHHFDGGKPGEKPHGRQSFFRYPPPATKPLPPDMLVNPDAPKK